MQCFLAKNLDNRNFNSVLSKMMIQVNAKLGGEPWSLKVPFKVSQMGKLEMYSVLQFAVLLY